MSHSKLSKFLVKKINKKNKGKVLSSFVLILTIVIILLTLSAYRFLTQDVSLKKEDILISNPNSFSETVEAVVLDISEGRNTQQTKSGLYIFLTRYFNNGGDIYEVYDYIETTPELSFLKEAENLNSEVFKKIHNKKLPHTYSDEGMYAYLAYLEVLETHGYGDVAVSSTLVHQYIKMAYYKKMIRNDKDKGQSLNYPPYTEKEITSDIKKSLQFLSTANSDMGIFFNDPKVLETLYNYDFLIGLIQYGSALRYLESLNVGFASSYSSREIFSFAIKYSYETAPDMYLFTSLSNASTLLLLSSYSGIELRNAVYPFFDIRIPINKKDGLVGKILNSKFERIDSRFMDLDIYSFKNISSIANKVPEFKTWLILNGWLEGDFK